MLILFFFNSYLSLSYMYFVFYFLVNAKRMLFNYKTLPFNAILWYVRAQD